MNETPFEEYVMMAQHYLIKCVFASALSLSFSAWSAGELITIGTGSETGVYYPSGSAICKLVNQQRSDYNILCSIEATGGSISNINALRTNEIDFGIVQSDWQYHAYQGSDPFEKNGSIKKLRAVFSLYTEPFNIIVRANSGIENIKDLAGKRINIGNSGSGDRATMQVVMKAFHWNNASFKLASELKGSERSQALCNNKIDAYIYMVGHPNGSIREATTSCNAELVPAIGPEIDQIIEENPYYTHTVIPAEMYRKASPETKSFGVVATLVTTSDVSEDMVYSVVKSVFENFDEFKHSHPALSQLKKEDMISAGLSIPLHPGALRYYREIGLLK